MNRPRCFVSPVCLAVLSLSVLGLASSPATVEAGLVTVGTDTSSNSFPFNFIGGSYSGEYQQIYTPTAFSGPVTISSLAFATATPNESETIGFTLSLSTTSLSNLTSPSTNYAANRGSDFTQVFSGSKTFSSADNGTFDVVFGISPFTYNPSMGALLVDFNVTSVSASGPIFFEANTDATTARIYNYAGNGAATVGSPSDSTGLVTQFNVSPAALVPEPSSLALLGLGVAGLLAGRRLGRQNRVCRRIHPIVIAGSQAEVQSIGELEECR